MEGVEEVEEVVDEYLVPAADAAAAAAVPLTLLPPPPLPPVIRYCLVSVYS